MQIQMKNFKYEAAMKCKVGPKLVKGSNVVLPYTCLNRNIQIPIYKHKYTNTNKYEYSNVQICKVGPKFGERQQCVAAIQMELDGTHVQTPSTRTPQPTHGQISKYLDIHVSKVPHYIL